MHLKRWIILIAFIMPSCGLFSQEHGRYKFQKISVEKGLSQSVVTSITQDHNGFLWFATQDGLNRFDGYHFTNYFNEKSNIHSLSNNFIQQILFDRDKKLWIATSDGLNLYDYESEIFTSFYSIESDSNSIGGNDVTSLAISRDKNLWVGTADGGFNYLDIGKKSFTRYRHKTNDDNCLSGNNVSCLLEDNNGILWIGTQGAGLNSCNPKTGKFKHFGMQAGNPNSLQSNTIRCIYLDPLNNLWIGTNKGLALFNPSLQNFILFGGNLVHTNSIGSNIIMAILGDSFGKLWIGTEQDGLYRLDLSELSKKGNKANLLHFTMQDNEFGLSMRSILSIFEDRNKNIWIGTYSGGINFVSIFEDKFEKYQHNPYNKNSLNYPKIWGLCEDLKGNLWVGTDGGGLDMMNMQTKEITHHVHSDNDPGSISDNAILCGFRDHTGTLWFGTYAGGLNRYNASSNSFTSFRFNPSNPNGIPLNDVRAIFEDRNNTLWIGTNGSGLSKFDELHNKFISFNPNNSKIANGRIRAIFQDNYGKLWLGLFGGGVDVYDETTGEFHNYSNNKTDINSLSSNYVFAIRQDKKGRIWLGTGGGLNLFIPSTGTFKTYAEKAGLANNYIHAILIDNEDNLWISTNRGISKFLPEEEKFQNFDAYDGLQSGEFNPGSALYATEGYMCFGGIHGLNLFFPEKVNESNFIPEIVLTGFQLFNDPVKPRSELNPSSPLTKSITEATSISLTYKQSVFTIDYVALNYTYPEKTQYEYKMEGLDKDWNAAGTKRSATYRDLKAGNYIFKVRATNHDGIWSNKFASLQITIMPPFWKTWWAYLLYLLSIAMMIYLLYSYYERQSKLKNNLLLEQINRQKEQQLNQEKLRFFTNISHEFRTPLTLIIGPMEEMLEKETNRTPLGRKLLLVYKNAHKLLDLINMLMDFQKVETGNMQLKVAKGNIIKFTKEICLAFRELGKQKNIQFEFKSQVNDIVLWFDREKMEIIYNNLLSNAFKYTSESGKISVEITEGNGVMFPPEKEVVFIKVADTGIGIPQNYISKIFDRYYSIDHNQEYKGTGIGLTLAKSLVELQKGKISVESVESQGTIFTIELLKGLDHFETGAVIADFKNSEDPYHYKTKSKILVENHITEYPDSRILAAEEMMDMKIMLIIEDNDDVRSYIKDNFQNKFLIIEATNGIDGLRQASEKLPDIIISDVMMPKMDGIEFCGKIKSTVSTCHIPVILLTARSSLTHKKEGYDIGADSYVTKPFSVDLLASRVENLLKSRNQLREYYNRSLLLKPVEKLAQEQSPDELFLKHMVETIELHISEADFDVNKLAQELNFSRAVLYRKVKALTDMSIIEFITKVRLNKALQLIKTGKYRISEVAYEVGFNDLKYFRQCFKEQFQLSPSDLL